MFCWDYPSLDRSRPAPPSPTDAGVPQRQRSDFTSAVVLPIQFQISTASHQNNSNHSLTTFLSSTFSPNPTSSKACRCAEYWQTDSSFPHVTLLSSPLLLIETSKTDQTDPRSGLSLFLTQILLHSSEESPHPSPTKQLHSLDPTGSNSWGSKSDSLQVLHIPCHPFYTAPF